MSLIGNISKKIPKIWRQGDWIVKKQPFQAEVIEQVKYINRLNCKGIVPIRKWKKRGDMLLLYMEDVEGESLSNLLKKKGRFPEEEAVKIGIQLCEVLYTFHSNQPRMIYRDMKPANVLINDKGQVYLIDFDTVWIQGRKHFADKKAVGTEGYAPFEQYIEGMEFQETTDIYALGITLMELLTNERPWEQPSVEMWIKRWRGKIAEELLEIVEGCTKELMQEREQSCREVQRKLQQIVWML